MHSNDFTCLWLFPLQVPEVKSMSQSSKHHVLSLYCFVVYVVVVFTPALQRANHKASALSDT